MNNKSQLTIRIFVSKYNFSAQDIRDQGYVLEDVYSNESRPIHSIVDRRRYYNITYDIQQLADQKSTT